MKRLHKSLLMLAAGAGIALAQTEPRYLEDILKDEVLPQSVALFQLRQYILNRVAKPPASGHGRTMVFGVEGYRRQDRKRCRVSRLAEGMDLFATEVERPGCHSRKRLPDAQAALRDLSGLPVDGDSLRAVEHA